MICWCYLRPKRYCWIVQLFCRHLYYYHKILCYSFKSISSTANFKTAFNPEPYSGGGWIVNSWTTLILYLLTLSCCGWSHWFEWKFHLKVTASSVDQPLSTAPLVLLVDTCYSISGNTTLWPSATLKTLVLSSFEQQKGDTWYLYLHRLSYTGCPTGL